MVEWDRTDQHFLVLFSFLESWVGKLLTKLDRARGNQAQTLNYRANIRAYARLWPGPADELTATKDLAEPQIQFKFLPGSNKSDETETAKPANGGT